jgi:hypothetical protein
MRSSFLWLAVGLVLPVHLKVPSEFPSIVFVSRQPIVGHKGTPGIGPVYRTAAVGGSLLLRTAAGSLTVLVDSNRLFDVADPSVSWDGATIVFSGLAHPDSQWRIYRIRRDGTGFAQLTFTDRSIDLTRFGASASKFTRYDDFDPCFLPDGRVVFASTRYPSMASYGGVRTSNLFVMSEDGSAVQRITTERNGAEEPTVDPVTGRIVFARWWMNVDRPSNVTRTGVSRNENEALTDDIANVWQAITIKPDGGELRLYAGFPRTRAGMQAYKPAVMTGGQLLCVYSGEHSLLTTPGPTGIRWFNKGADIERPLAGASLEGITSTQSATDPAPMDDKEFLFSYAEDGADYDIWLGSLESGAVRKIVGLPGTLELDAQVVASRPVPPVLSDLLLGPRTELPPTEDPATLDELGTFRFDCMNIFMNGSVDEMIPDAPRIVKGARIRFFMNPQRTGSDEPDPSVLLKDTIVFPGGNIHVSDIPADVPLFEQIVDRNGRVLLTSSGRFAHVTGLNFERPGAGTKCVGCHTGHSLLTVPINKSTASWFNAAPSARVTASSYCVDPDGTDYPPIRVVDRQAAIGIDTSIWLAASRKNQWIALRWDLPIEVRQIVLYPVLTPAGQGIRIVDGDVSLYCDQSLVRTFPVVGGALDRIQVDVDVSRVDSVVVSLRKTEGRYGHRRLPGLGEIEVSARIPLDHL